MCADFSRQRFRSFNNYFGVLSQQGRVQLDADANEFVEMLDRRFRASTTDLAGPGSVVSKVTPGAFLISAAQGGKLNIGRGRMYVDGLLAENHGAAPAPAGTSFAFDPVLHELRGTESIDFTDQPYFPGAALLPPNVQPAVGDTWLAYLDVWQREITHLHEPDLVEKAVGIDTTARLRTVWQVRLLKMKSGDGCGAQSNDWDKLIRPSAGRLSSDTKGPPSKENPCLIPPSAGYRGLENQLYRVQIHKGGGLNEATFKWSRENASVATNVTAINADGDELTVVSTGRDAVLSFRDGDWVEVTDEATELSGEPGQLRKIAGGGVNRDARTVKLTTPLVGFSGGTLDEKRRTIVRRWDQAGRVFDEDGNLLKDLEGAGSSGDIPLPKVAAAVLLENGIRVSFKLVPGEGESDATFHSGDYWVFAARSADATVEELVDAPPRGLHHHYTRLATVKVTAISADGPPTLEVTDCRPKQFTPECGDCTVCVNSVDHNSGTFTIQDAIDKVISLRADKKPVGGTICLGIGQYLLAKPLRLDRVSSVQVRGQGLLTQLINPAGSGIEIASSIDVTIEDMAVTACSAGGVAASVCAISNSATVTVQRCHLTHQHQGQDGAGAVIALAGSVTDTFIRENIVTGGSGIVGIMVGDHRVRTSGFCVLDNFIVTTKAGVSFDKGCSHDADTRIAGNFFKGSADAAAILATGSVVPGSRLDILGNLVRTAGDGFVIGTSDTRIADNDIGPDFKDTAAGNVAAEQTKLGAAGIALVPCEAGPMNRCHILGNRVRGLGGVGIRISTTVVSAVIRQNTIERTALGGIVMDLKLAASAGVLTVESNQLRDTALGLGDSKDLVGAVLVVNGEQVTISGNSIVGLAERLEKDGLIAGIGVVNARSVRISGNHLRNIGPPKNLRGSAVGIVAAGLLGRIDVTENEVQRSPGAKPTNVGNWRALSIVASNSKLPDGFAYSKLPDGFAYSKVKDAMLANVESMVSGGLKIDAPPPPSCAVRGNSFEGFGASPLLFVLLGGPCIIAENRAVFLSKEDVPIAQFAPAALILSANHFHSPSQGQVQAFVRPRQCTVLGNISSGPIKIGLPPGDLLGPWQGLNVML